MPPRTLNKLSGSIMLAVNDLIQNIKELYSEEGKTNLKYCPIISEDYADKEYVVKIHITFPNLLSDADFKYTINHPDTLDKTLDIEINNLKEEIYLWFKQEFNFIETYMEHVVSTQGWFNDSDIASLPVLRNIKMLSHYFNHKGFHVSNSFNPEKLIHQFVGELISPFSVYTTLQYSEPFLNRGYTFNELDYIILESIHKLHQGALQELNKILEVEDEEFEVEA